MMLGYSITSITGQFSNMNRAFEPFVQGGIDVIENYPLSRHGSSLSLYSLILDNLLLVLE